QGSVPRHYGHRRDRVMAGHSGGYRRNRPCHDERHEAAGMERRGWSLMTDRMKAPLALRMFQYVLWGTMLLVVVWFVALPMLSKALAPAPPPPPGLSPQ